MVENNGEADIIGKPLGWKIIVLLLGCLVVGFILGYACDIDSPSYYDADKLISNFEKLLFQVTEIRPGLVNDKTTIGEAREYYFYYGMWSKGLLGAEIGKLCGKIDYENIPGINSTHFNDSLNKFCKDVCYVDYSETWSK